MKPRHLLLLLPLALFVVPVTAQQAPSEASGRLHQGAIAKRTQPPNLSELSTPLRNALARVKVTARRGLPAAKAALERALGPNDFILDAAGRIQVELRVDKATPALLEQVGALDFEVSASTYELDISANHQTIAGWAYFDRLQALAALAGVFHIRAAAAPVSRIGAVTTEGDAIHAVRGTRLYLGVDGNGETVGVISTGVDHLPESQALGELPADVAVISNALGCIAQGTDCDCEDGTFGCEVRDEGTAMLEIVHDLAPRTRLLFNDNGHSPTEFAAIITQLADHGSSVIVDDLGWFTAPVYEDGVIAQTVDQVVAGRDVVYVTSAGNSTARPRYHAADFTDLDGDDWHEFSSGDEFINIEIPPQGWVSAFLQWNNRYGGASDDYDLFVYDEGIRNLLTYSVDVQDGTGDPLERVGLRNLSERNPLKVAIGVEKAAGEARHLTLFLNWRRGTFPTIEAHPQTNSATVWGHAAARESLAVGAINSGSSALAIAPYSSRGPSRIYDYDADGRPVAFFAREKPDLAGIDDVSISGVGGFGSKRCETGVVTCFRGTSASAPHVAAIAALVRQKKPSAGAGEVRQILSETAIDLGAPGRDLVYGEGLVDALASVKRACAECAGRPTRLFNISTNGPLTGRGMQAGFVVRGNEAKRFVVLAEQLSGGVDAQLSLTDLGGGVVYDENDDWQSHATAGEVEAELRAPGDPRDAGFAITLDPGTYIARMSSKNGVSGAGIVAVNDLGVAAGDAELLNISTNGRVDARGLFAGFIVPAGSAQRFIIYAERFGSAIDPLLSVTDLSGAVIFDANDNWRSHPTAGEIRARLRAPGHELDAAFAITLPPGTYIARMRSRNGQAGAGIVAINNVSAL